MFNLQGVTRAYEQVNVAGKVHDCLLNPLRATEAGVAGMAHLRHVQARRVGQPASLQQKAAFFAHDVPRYLLSRTQFAFGVGLTLQRRVPLFWLPPLVMPLSPLAWARIAKQVHPVAELLVGTGRSGGQLAAYFTGRSPLHFIAEFVSWASYHGVAGSVLEALPAMAADACARSRYYRVATACMTAALIGRVLLQVPRLALCLITFAVELGTAICLLGLLITLEGMLLLCRAGLCFVADHTGRNLRAPIRAVDIFLFCIRDVANYTVASDVVPQNPTPLVAGDSQAFDKVRSYTTRLCERFAGVTNDDEEAHRQVRTLAAQASADLRAYCGNLSSDGALRFGLRLLKEFIDLTWNADKVAFNPPELAGSP